MPNMIHHSVYWDRRFHAAFPAAVLLGDGSVLVGFRRARDHRHLIGAFPVKVAQANNDSTTDAAADFDQVDHLDCRSHIALLRLGADLSPLGPPWMAPADPEAGDQDANLLRLQHPSYRGRVLQSGFCWYPVSPWAVPRLQKLGVGVVGGGAHHGVGFVFWGGYTRWSDDNGRSWSDRRDLPRVPGFPDQVPGERPYLGGPVRGRAVETPDGRILQGAYAEAPGTRRGMALLHESSDGGAGWTYRGIIANDPEGGAGFLEPTLALAENGVLFAFHRTTNLDGRIAMSASGDGGESWEPWRALDAIGHPCDACPLPDGRILLVYGYRYPPFGVRARLWNPRTRDFDISPAFGAEIIIRDDAPSPDVGYPWATLLPDGKIAVFYYIANGWGMRGIDATLLNL